jgi:hypothetical protein
MKLGASNLNDLKETVSQFMDKITQAQVLKETGNGDGWVETDPAIIKLYNPKGLNGGKYFIYQGIKVCEEGLKEKILEEEDTQIGRKLHGKDEGLVESGA